MGSGGVSYFPSYDAARSYVQELEQGDSDLVELVVSPPDQSRGDMPRYWRVEARPSDTGRISDLGRTSDVGSDVGERD